MAQAQLDAQRLKKTDMVGIGCLVQLVGIITAIALSGFGPVGWILGGGAFVAAMIIGSRMATRHLCGHCNNPLASGMITVCPACRAELYSPRDWAARHKG